MEEKQTPKAKPKVKRERTTIILESSLMSELKDLASEKQTSVSRIIRLAVTDFIKNLKKQKHV